MPNIKAITNEAFSEKRWRRKPDYLFSAKHSACFLTNQELPKALLDMPLGFLDSGDSYVLIAVTGLQDGVNLYVGDRGEWLGNYPPAALRSYPFSLLPSKENSDQLVFCIDEESGLVSDNSEGEQFFDSQGNLDESLTKVMSLLAAVYADKQSTDRLCAILGQHGLIKPWELKIKLDKGVHQVNGLFGIDEEALTNLPDEDFLELRRSGALFVAQCQLLSMQNIERLVQRFQNISKQGADSDLDLDLEELSFGEFGPDGNISFDNL